MPAKSRPKPERKMPVACVMWATSYMHLHNKDKLTPIYNGKIPDLNQIPVLVTPYSTHRQAKAALSFARKTESEKVEAIKKVLGEQVSRIYFGGHVARAILALISGQSGKEWAK